MLEENRAVTIEAVRSHRRRSWVWPGTATIDRCFFFDEQGAFIEGYYLVGLLAEVFLRRHRGARIVHDPRLTWNTIDIVQQCGGEPVLCKSGHAFIKQKMREVDAVYGGEMSAHHYFRDFAYCDSGMIPWLLVLAIMSESGKIAVASWSASASGSFRPAARSIASSATAGGDAKSVLARVQQHYRRARRASISPMACRWNSTAGASICAAPTPSRWCA